MSENQRGCALCAKALDQSNNSDEHLISNGIGGQKKVRDVLCRSCNSETGRNWDAAVTEQLNFFNLLFETKRDRGSVRTSDFSTISGQRVRMHAEGYFTFPTTRPKITESDLGVRVQQRVATKRDAEKFVRGMKRQYPALDVEEAMKSIEVKRSYMDEPINVNLTFGGPRAGRSVVKSAYVLAVSSGVPAKSCERARAYLLHENGDPCFGYYYERDLVTDRPSDIVFHCVAVEGDPSTGQLVGYVELFSAYRMVVCLSCEYVGTAFWNSYAVNPATGEEIVLSFDLSFTADELRNACAYQKDCTAGVRKAVEQVMEIGYPASLKRERERACKDAFHEAMCRVGVKPGDTVSPEQSLEFSRIFTELVTPCIVHQLSLGRKLERSLSDPMGDDQRRDEPQES